MEAEKYLVFEVDSAICSIPIDSVREIIEYAQVDLIPLAPECILGAIDLRGGVIPVIDLSTRLGKHNNPVTKRTCIVIAECRVNQTDIVFGLKVDLVQSVVNITTKSIEPMPSIGGQYESKYVAGLAKVKESLVAVLNLEQLLTLDDVGEIVAAHVDSKGSMNV